MRFLLGGYGADMDGSATGIGVLERTDAGELSFRGDAVTVAGSPSWLARHPSREVIYAAMEGAGAVRAFARTGEASWAPLGTAVPVGELPCHVAVSADGRILLASCWGDGRLVALPLDARGVPGEPVPVDAAVDSHTTPDAALEASGLPIVLDPATEPRPSRAHQSLFLPGGLVVSVDMGLDLLRFWRREGGRLRADQELALPFGVGPRHGVWHPSGHLYVVCESSCEAYVLRPSPEGRWRVVGATALSPATLPGDAAAELCCSHDAEFLYAGVRGSDTIAVLRVRGDGSALAPVALAESGVTWPRHHLVVRDTLLVAGQHSNEIAEFTVDIRTGVPGRVRRRTEAPSPAQVLALD